MDITAPKHPPQHPDRGLDCEFAIEPAFQEAIATGWSNAEAAEAMLELARNHIVGILADQGTERDIEAAARSIS